MMDFDDLRRGSRKTFILRVLDTRGRYPNIRFRTQDALYVATESIVYSVVEASAPNKVGFSEIAWNDINEIRLWGALALSIKEGSGFYVFIPQYRLEEPRDCTIWLSDLREDVVSRVADRMAARMPPSRYQLHWLTPPLAEVNALYDALGKSEPAVLRGVNCFLKSLLIWSLPEGGLLTEEIGLNLYVALEAGLSTIRRRMSVVAGHTVSYAETFEFVAIHFTAGEGLAEYWMDTHDDRNALLHPDNDFSPYVIQPMWVDDICELFDPMLSLYRYILLGEPRPTVEEITGRRP
jgi:hypothetical protein